MRVQTLGFLPRSFAPQVFHNASSGIAIPGMIRNEAVRRRGIAGGLGEAGLTESIGLLTLGGVVGGALGFAIGAAIVSWASHRRRY